MARRYWEAFAKVLPEHLDFQGRTTSSHQNNASEPVNLALNYGYGFLEGEVRRAINSVGLELSIGFLHDFSDYQTKQSLVYDLEEPFRWLIDVSVIEAFESGTLELRGFYFTGEDYRYRFEADAKQHFIDLIRERFNGGAVYESRSLKWDTIIEQKVIELGRVLVNRAATVDFAEPEPPLARCNDRELRAGILSLSQSEARRLGVGKSTLHYLKNRARTKRRFVVYSNIRAKLT